MPGPRILGASEVAAGGFYGRSALKRYGLAVVCALAATGLDFLLRPILGPGGLWLFFFPAVLFAAWYGRFWAGVITTVSALLVAYLWWGLRFSAQTSAGAAGFAVGALLICWAAEVSHRARRDLELERKFLDTVLSSITDGIIVLDKEWRYAYINDAAVALSRKRRQELENRVVWEAFPRLRGTVFEQNLLRSRRENIPVHFETTSQSGDLWLEMRAHPMGGSTVIYVTDISARKSTELELARTREQLARHASRLEQLVHERTARLEDTVSELEHFSYTISHDLRAPLRTLEAFSTFIIDEYWQKLDTTGRDYLNRIRSAAQRMDRLINDVLSYTHLSRREVTLAPISLDPLVDELVGQYAPEAKSHIQIRHPLGRGRGSEALLTQAISNLLVNAAKFVPPNTPPAIEIWTEQAGGSIRLYIRDRGIGIPAEARGKVFNMFERAHSGFPGTGVGLAVVKRAMERMNGQVGFESEVDRGSTFWIELPAV